MRFWKSLCLKVPGCGTGPIHAVSRMVSGRFGPKMKPPSGIVPEGGRCGARVCHCCEAVYSSAILRTAAARFSLSGCEENIFCTVDALAPCDSSTSFSSDAAMP